MNLNITTVEELTNAFIVHCVANNLTDQSIEAYEVKLKPFKAFYDGKLCEINTLTVESYIVYLKRNTKANSVTINTYLRSLRALLYYGMKLGVVEQFKVHLPKADKNTKVTYTEDELRRLIPEDGSFSSMTELKIWALESFLMATGVRLSTALELKLEDIDFNNKMCLLSHMKNRKQQYIPLSDGCIKRLERYLDARGRVFSEYVFSNCKGLKMDKRTLQQQVASYNKKRGVATTSIHAFRHTYAKMSVLNGVDIFRLQKLMSHSSILVTKEYVDLYGEELRGNGWSPLEML